MIIIYTLSVEYNRIGLPSHVQYAAAGAVEQNYHISPYAYCAGDPVNRIDPDGMAENHDCFGAKHAKKKEYRSRRK
jgi:hypothetical protein